MSRRPECLYCTHSIGMDARTAERDMVRDRGYSNDYGPVRDGVALVCTKRQVIRPRPINSPGRPCRFEREAGTGPGEGDS